MAEETTPNTPKDPTSTEFECGSLIGDLSISESLGAVELPEGSSGLSQIADEINNAADALEQMTDCDAIKELVKDAVSDIVELTVEIGSEITEILSTWLPILNVPSNPLKIIKWAIKVATGPAGAQIFAIVVLALELVAVATAIARMAGAIATAAENIRNCTEAALLDALDDITCNLLGDAEDILNLANNIVGQWEALGDLKGEDLLEIAAGVDPNIAALGDSVTSLDSSRAATEGALDRLRGFG